MNKVTVVVSGKGGTGKTTVSTGLAIALARKNKKVLLVDCDCGMRGVDLMLGIENLLVFDSSDVISGNCQLEKAIYPVEKISGLSVLPAPVLSDNEVSPQLLIQLIETVRENYDEIIVDAPAGIGSGFESACACADRALIVVNAEPISIRGCLNVRNKLTQMGINDIKMIINKFDRKSFTQMNVYPDLDSVIDYAQTQLIGLVPFDLRLACTTQCGQAGMYWSKSYAVFDCIAQRLEGANINIVCPLK